jgi:PadR family transcriptional regulator, regulatory protein PadR
MIYVLSGFMISRELVAASSRGLVLGILAEGPSYGYALIQRVRELSEEEIVWTDGMLYPVLHRLEKDGLIKSEWRDSEAGRERKYYRLTEGGKKARKAEQAEWLTVHNTLAKLWKIKTASI